MLNSVEMVPHGSNRLVGIVLVVGVGLISAVTTMGEERPHPSLVDPTITKCTVCHQDVGSTHPPSASGQACLSCHTFETRGKKTLLVVEDTLRPQDGGGVQVGAGTDVAGVERDHEVSPVSPDDAAATKSAPPPVETVYEVAPVRPTPPPAAAPETIQSERPTSVVVSGDQDAAGLLYADGMAAFTGGEFDRAFQIWRSMLADKTDHYVVQVEVNTYLESAQWTIATFGSHSLYVLKKDDLYWVFSGVFATRAQAAEALGLLPEPLRQGGAFPIEVRQILPQP